MSTSVAPIRLPELGTAPAYVEGHHAVSPFNFEVGLQQSYDFRRPMVLVDSTIRKLLKTSGTRITADRVLKIAEALSEVGVHEMILNVSWWGGKAPAPAEFSVFKEVASSGLDIHITVDCDALGATKAYSHAVSVCDAFDLLQEAGLQTIAVPADVPTGSAADRDHAREMALEVFEVAAERGVPCNLLLVDPARRDFTDVVSSVSMGIEHRVGRIDIADSYSSLCPQAARVFVLALRDAMPVDTPISMHIHNDFGMATAGALAAASAGAYPDVAVNGISYRAGFAALEEVALSLELLYGVDSGIHLEQLQQLSELVERELGFPMPPMKPITGSHAYVRDHPMWMTEYLENAFPPSASCYVPSVSGGKMSMVWGYHPGNSVIRAKLRQMGLGASDEKVGAIRASLDQALESKKTYPIWVTEQEMEQICRDVAS